MRSNGRAPRHRRPERAQPIRICTQKLIVLSDGPSTLPTDTHVPWAGDDFTRRKRLCCSHCTLVPRCPRGNMLVARDCRGRACSLDHGSSCHRQHLLEDFQGCSPPWSTPCDLGDWQIGHQRDQREGHGDRLTVVMSANTHVNFIRLSNFIFYTSLCPYVISLVRKQEEPFICHTCGLLVCLLFCRSRILKSNQ